MTSRSIGSNALALTGARIVSAGAALVTSVVAARSLGASDFGSLVAIVALAFVANTFVTFGTDTLVVREAAIDSTTTEVASSIGLQLSIAAPLMLATGVAVAAGANTSLAIAAIGLLPGVWSTTALAALRGRERMDLAAAAHVVGAVVAVFGALVAAVLEAGVPGFVASVVAASAATGLTAFTLARRVLLASWRPDISGTTWKRAAPFASMVAATAVATSSGILSLELLGAEEATGHYGAATRVSEGLRLLPAAFFGAAFPAMARSVHRTDGYAKTVARITTATLVLAGVIVLFAAPIVDVLYGGFDSSVAGLRVLAIGLVPVVFRLRWSFELIADGDERSAAHISIVSAVATLLLTMAAAVVAGSGLVAAATVAGLCLHAGLLWLRTRRSADVAGVSE